VLALQGRQRVQGPARAQVQVQAPARVRVQAPAPVRVLVQAPAPVQVQQARVQAQAQVPAPASAQVRQVQEQARRHVRHPVSQALRCAAAGAGANALLQQLPAQQRYSTRQLGYPTVPQQRRQVASVPPSSAHPC